MNPIDLIALVGVMSLLYGVYLLYRHLVKKI